MLANKRLIKCLLYILTSIWVLCTLIKICFFMFFHGQGVWVTKLYKFVVFHTFLYFFVYETVFLQFNVHPTNNTNKPGYNIPSKCTINKYTLYRYTIHGIWYYTDFTCKKKSGVCSTQTLVKIYNYLSSGNWQHLYVWQLHSMYARCKTEMTNFE